MSRPREEIGDSYVTPPIRIIVEDDKPSSAILYLLGLCRSIITKINGRLSFGDAVDGRWSGNFDGQWRIADSGASTVPFEVEHGLNRIPQGFFFTADNSGTVYATLADRASWNKTTIRLRTAGTNVRVYLIIF